MVSRTASGGLWMGFGRVPIRRDHVGIELRRWLRPLWFGLVIASCGLLVATGLLPVAKGFGKAVDWFDATYLTEAEQPLFIPAFPRDTTIYAANGKVLARIYMDQNRVEVPLSEVAPVARQAVLAAEDHQFYAHGALDFRSIVRAEVMNLRAGRIVEGGSTITQQLAKINFAGAAQTFARKIDEAEAAIRLERTYTKQQILEMYLNQIYFGSGVYGVGTAARYYFNRPASQLNLAQSALLAGLISAPATHEPIHHRAAARARRNEVLERMATLGWITPDQFRRASEARLGLSRAGRDQWGLGPEPYFVRYVEREFLQDPRFGVDYEQRLHKLFEGGLKIYTTLDPTLQKEARAAIRTHLPDRTDPQAALVTIHPRTGAIEAMVGGRDFRRSQFDLAAQSGRSAGSAFKVFTLTAALEEGIPPSRTFSSAEPITIPDCGGMGVPWHVGNAEPGTGGPMDLWDGIKYSVNVVFAQLINIVGPREVAAVAHRMGITSRLTSYCPLTLGASPVSPLEMTSGYATLANRGVHCRPFAIARVVGPDGTTDYQATPWCHRAVPIRIADQVTAMLQGVVRDGTGTAANIGRPQAGKTGTAQNYQDAWFLGYIPQMCTGVWVGYPRGEVPMLDVHGLRGFGGLLAAPIWHDFMEEATRGLRVVDFPRPLIPEAIVQSALPQPLPTPSGPAPTPSPSP
jgi:membrane peptidoglycan carboxypeptidase